MKITWKKGAVLDFETTGLDEGAGLTQIGVVTFDQYLVAQKEFQWLVDPGPDAVHSEWANQNTTWGRLSEEERQERYVDLDEALAELAEVLVGRALMCHSIKFEKMWLKKLYARPAVVGLPYAEKVRSDRAFASSIDTFYLSAPLKAQGLTLSCALRRVANTLGLKTQFTHDALGDCRTTLAVGQRLLRMRAVII